MTATDLSQLPPRLDGAAGRPVCVRYRTERAHEPADAIVLNELGGARARRDAGRSHRHRLLLLGCGRPDSSRARRTFTMTPRSYRLPAWPPTGVLRPTIRASPARTALRIGIRHSRSISSRIRPEDERYWEEYRTTPKAFISVRARPRSLAIALRRADVDSASRPDGADAGALAARLRDELRTTLSPNAMGVALYPARAAALEAAQGATDFGQYLHLLQFFPDGVGPDARRALLQAGSRAAPAPDRNSPRGRLLDVGRPAAAPRRGNHPRCRRRRARYRRRHPVWKAHRARSRHLVGRRGRDDDAGAACAGRARSSWARLARSWSRRCVSWSRFAPSGGCRRVRS